VVCLRTNRASGSGASENERERSERAGAGLEQAGAGGSGASGSERERAGAERARAGGSGASESERERSKREWAGAERARTSGSGAPPPPGGGGRPLAPSGRLALRVGVHGVAPSPLSLGARPLWSLQNHWRSTLGTACRPRPGHGTPRGHTVDLGELGSHTSTPGAHLDPGPHTSTPVRKLGSPPPQCAWWCT